MAQLEARYLNGTSAVSRADVAAAHSLGRELRASAAAGETFLDLGELLQDARADGGDGVMV